MKNYFIRLLSFSLTVCMLLSLNTAVVFAEGEAIEEENSTASAEAETVVNPYSDSIDYANNAANSIVAKYTDSSSSDYTVKNQNMSLEYSLSAGKGTQLSALKDKSGTKSYLSNTMDAYVKMTDGNIYYASESGNDARVNIFKHGFYYYDVHMLGQSFNETTKETAIDASKFSKKSDFVTNYSVANGVITYTVNGSDPFVYTAYNSSKPTSSNPYFSASEYNAIQFTLKATKSTSGQIYFVAGNHTGHTADQVVDFKITNDGEYHTYLVYIDGVADYQNYVHGIRFDVGNSNTIGETVQIKDIKMLKMSSEAPKLQLDRVFHTYADKMHQELHFVATEDVSGIAEVGMITKIDSATVAKLIIKDAAGEKSSLSGVDWSTVEYLAFDISGVGIFGYILPAGEKGTVKVELADGVYTVTQKATPAGGTIKAYPVDDPATTDVNEAKATNTSNDFRMGQRIYTDENHDFAAFRKEAEIERNPIAGLEYDAIRGSYELPIDGTGFNKPFLAEWNKHYTAEATLNGEGKDRNIYICAGYYGGGCVEGAALLDGNDMLLPIPMEVAKNFGGENEEPIFNAGDMEYSETIFPLALDANQSISFTVLNLYQNWGQTPLKQLSSIQYFKPYYHLSLGTTETSCIAPWFGVRDLWTLPDFRSQSMKYWFELTESEGYSNQPQHTHAGYQYFLQYTDAEGKHNATENISNVINSSGPVYADVDMTYISDDGKIKVTYNHIEMPQTDELRAYYEIEYEILGEVTINDFANDFSFYSLEGYSGYYQNIGYWAEQGEEDGVVHAVTNGSDTAEKLVLGNDSPYVALYNLKTADDSSWKNNNANLAFVIHSSDIVIGGEKRDNNFVVTGKNYVYSLSMDLGTVTLKPGDTIKLNIVLSPWGWTDSKDDSVVQTMRENTCVNPLTVTVGEGSKIDSPFLPRIESANGNSAEFTLSGGTSNVAVRVYGFNKLTAPQIYEKVNGAWTEYKVSSYQTPDREGYNHSYDGYTVYKDGDTYSYAFAVDMTNADSRTFKVVADDFRGWPEEKRIDPDPINVYQTPGEIHLYSGTKYGIKCFDYAENGSYLRLYSDGDKGEAFFNVYTGNTQEVTGNYVVIKYRLPETNSAIVGSFDVFTSTVNASAKDTDAFSISGIKNDGEWHVLVVEISKFGKTSTFAPDPVNGEYIAKYLRIDVFNSKMGENDYIDIAYVGMSDDLADICLLNADMGSITLATGTNSSETVNTSDYISGFGDVDGDRDIDLSDIIALRNYIVGVGETKVQSGADANGDGVINTKDLILLRQYLANYDYESKTSTVVLGKQSN